MQINFMGKKNKIHPIEGSGHSEILFADTPNAGRGTEASHSGSTLSALDAPSLSWADNPRKVGILKSFTLLCMMVVGKVNAGGLSRSIGTGYIFLCNKLQAQLPLWRYYTVFSKG